MSRNLKNIRVFLSENFQFLEMKFSLYLDRRVFVMMEYKKSKISRIPRKETYLEKPVHLAKIDFAKRAVGMLQNV